MSDLPPPLNPSRSLRRAGNILSPDGQLTKEFTHFDGASDSYPSSPTRHLSFAGKNGLGASIKRRFEDFKVQSRMGRSKSFNDAPAESQSIPILAENRRHKGHSKSLAIERSTLQADLSTPAAISDIVPAPRTPAVLPTVTAETVIGNVMVPQLLQQGTPMTKVSLKTHKKVVFRLDADLGQMVWESKQQKIIPIENIKEIRSGADARFYRQQFQLSQDYEDRWLTIVYVLDGRWKTLHLIAATKDQFKMWDTTLRELHTIRQELMHGLGNIEMRQALWEKRYWKRSDEENDQKLSFDEVEKLCRGLNINSSREDLERLFMRADTRQRQYLDFDDFRRFVKLLKGRPEIDRLYKKLMADSGIFDFNVFEKFMREKQKSTLPQSELVELFDKFLSSVSSAVSGQAIITLDTFTSFLLSSDNSVLMDQHKDTWHDMTRPLPEYFISSSHNTYLVGHQLVGDSTIEGYIRALLCSCRSVELDIYDGEVEPMIFHGKTFTSKVPLREVCKSIAKYGFVASPYPIIISAEVHCSLPQQDLIAEIMIDVFGDTLVRMPPNETKTKLEQLPSPEELKGKIMFKTKNLELTRSESNENEFALTSDPSSSASDSDMLLDATQREAVALPSTSSSMPTPTTPPTHKRRQSDQIREQILKARSTLIQHVRSVYGGQSPSSTNTPTSESDRSQYFPSVPVMSPSSPTTQISPKLSPPNGNPAQVRTKPRISPALLALLVYTVGVKCRGINKKEEYAPEHMFSLSETAANKMLRFNMWDLIKHTKAHLVRIYPKGTRFTSTNYEPHRFWASGAQLVAMNWQTFDLGYAINHAMFQRNGRSGYVLKPLALQQHAPKDLLVKRTMHTFDVTIISAQQLPQPRDSSGREVLDRAIVDPYVAVTLYIPDWPLQPETKLKERTGEKSKERARSKEMEDGSSHPFTPGLYGATSMPPRTTSGRTSAVKKNGFNPVWEEKLSIPFDCVGDMLDLIFVRFVVRQEDKDIDEPLAAYCASLGCLQRGYRHLPLHDSQVSQYLYSTLFVEINISNALP